MILFVQQKTKWSLSGSPCYMIDLVANPYSNHRVIRCTRLLRSIEESCLVSLLFAFLYPICSFLNAFSICFEFVVVFTNRFVRSGSLSGCLLISKLKASSQLSLSLSLAGQKQEAVVEKEDNFLIEKKIRLDSSTLAQSVWFASPSDHTTNRLLHRPINHVQQQSSRHKACSEIGAKPKTNEQKVVVRLLFSLVNLEANRAGSGFMCVGKMIRSGRSRTTDATCAGDRNYRFVAVAT